MLPGSVLAMLVIIILVHAARGLLSFEEDAVVLTWFAFIPARYGAEGIALPGGYVAPFPGGVAADVWTFVSYALLHGSLMHLVVNGVWLVAFGTAVARRFGGVRFWVFSASAAAGGAALHLVVHAGEIVPVVGASAAIAGQMAAAARFVFDAGGPMELKRRGAPQLYRLPARSLRDTFANRTAVVFIAIFFLVNLAVGLGSTVAGGLAIAWEAHLGGFFVGLLAFRLFDPVPR